MLHTRLIAGRFLIVAGAIVCGLASALGTAAHTVALPDHGSLTLVMPDAWQLETRQPPKSLPPTLSITPRSGTPFTVMITAVWPLGPASGLTDEATLRSEVAAVAKSAESQSVERSLPIREVSSTGGRGFYFSATDRAPKPGEFKFLTQGMIRKGDIALGFTILTNDGQTAVVESALEMLRTAVH